MPCDARSAAPRSLPSSRAGQTRCDRAADRLNRINRDSQPLLEQGLLKLASSDAELQLVLAHEIAHVDPGHCRRGLTYTVRAGELAGGKGTELVQQAYHLISLGYSEDQEFDADEWAFRHMLTIGRTKDQALALPRHFARHFADKTEQRQSTKEDSPAAVIADEIEKHLRSHPPATERVRRLEKLAAADRKG